MDYLEFKEIATRYVKDNYGSLDVLSIHNDYVETKLHKYMFTIMFEEYKPAPEDCMKLMDQCKEYEERMFKEYLKFY